MDTSRTKRLRKALYCLGFKPFETILDVGCGAGLLFKHIVDPIGVIVGVDIARELLNIAKKLIKNSRLNEVFLVRADADFLPFRDGVFDKVFAITLLQNMSIYLLTFNEIARVAKDDSVIVITGLKKTFSRKSLSDALRRAHLNFFLLDDEEDIKCYIAICSKGTSSKNINKREVEMIARW